VAEPLTRKQILDTTEQVLRRFGPDKTSVIDVARALGVSHGTLYRHFSSKAVLKEAVAERWLKNVSEPLLQVSKEKGESINQIRKWLETLIDLKRSKALEDPELFAMYNALAEESVEIIEAHIQELIMQLTSIVKEGIRVGELKENDAKDMASAIFYATARFHHPALAKEWVSPNIEEEFNLVWKLISFGMTDPK
jgi:AcrR family transcriptional regulator